MAARRKGKRLVRGDGSVTVHGKNANGLGSVYQTGDGRWTATWKEPGRKYPRKATGKTAEEAVRRRQERMAQGPNDTCLTVAELHEWWLNNIYKYQVSIDTFLKAEERGKRIRETLGDVSLDELDYAGLVDWQSGLLKVLKPWTVKNHRQDLVLVLDEAVKLGRMQGNPARSLQVPSPDGDDDNKPVYSVEEVRRLLKPARQHRLGAAVALLFLQGWRVSEVLGLAWDDIDFATGQVHLQRVSVYRRGVGRLLKPRAKSDGSLGEHWLMPTSSEFLCERRARQAAERAAAPVWVEVTMGKSNQPVDLVFTRATTGGLVARQHVQQAVGWCARKAGLDPVGIATHGGRRSVITALWSEGNARIEDIAEFVGHSDDNTTKGYVKRRGKRPQTFAQRAAGLLDPGAEGH